MLCRIKIYQEVELQDLTKELWIWFLHVVKFYSSFVCLLWFFFYLLSLIVDLTSPKFGNRWSSKILTVRIWWFCCTTPVLWNKNTHNLKVMQEMQGWGLTAFIPLCSSNNRNCRLWEMLGHLFDLSIGSRGFFKKKRFGNVLRFWKNRAMPLMYRRSWFTSRILALNFWYRFSSCEEHIELILLSL